MFPQTELAAAEGPQPGRPLGPAVPRRLKTLPPHGAKSAGGNEAPSWPLSALINLAARSWSSSLVLVAGAPAKFVQQTAERAARFLTNQLPFELAPSSPNYVYECQQRQQQQAAFNINSPHLARRPQTCGQGVCSPSTWRQFPATTLCQYCELVSGRHIRRPRGPRE